MKKLLLILAMLFTTIFSGYAQNYDDVYYKPSKETHKIKLKIGTPIIISDSVTKDTIYNDVVVGDISITYNSDDYYDYEYSSRIKRFHNYYYLDSYYSDYYTNIYWYDYNFLNWGTSIYMGYNFWNPAYYWGQSYYWSSYFWNSPYTYWGYSYWNYPRWDYRHNGHYYGHYYGHTYPYGGYGNHYYNSHDPNSNYGHRTNVGVVGNNRETMDRRTIEPTTKFNNETRRSPAVGRDNTQNSRYTYQQPKRTQNSRIDRNSETQRYTVPGYNAPRSSQEYISPKYRLGSYGPTENSRRSTENSRQNVRSTENSRQNSEMRSNERQDVRSTENSRQNSEMRSNERQNVRSTENSRTNQIQRSTNPSEYREIDGYSPSRSSSPNYSPRSSSPSYSSPNNSTPSRSSSPSSSPNNSTRGSSSPSGGSRGGGGHR